MNCKIESHENNIMTIEIELAEAEFEEGMQKAYNRTKSRFTVPGFRRGKAPRTIIQRYYGESAFFEDAVEILYPEAYDKAIDELKVSPVSRPDVDIKQIGKGKTFIFTAKFATKPEIVLGEYASIEIEPVDLKVTDEDIDKEIDKQREANARIRTVDDRPVENGDTAVIDFKGYIDGEAFNGGEGENHELVIGSGRFIPGFEEQLIGCNSGDDVDVNVKFPEDYHAAEMAGKEALFEVRIHEIRKKELPEADDEFAKDVSEFDTLDEYKTSVRIKLTEKNEETMKQQIRDRAVQKLFESSSVNIPDMMIDTRVDMRLEDLARRVGSRYPDLNEFLKLYGLDATTYKNQLRAEVINEIKYGLLVEKVAEIEKIEASEEEIEAKILEMAEQAKQEAEEFRQKLQTEERDELKRQIKFEKAVELIASRAVQTENIKDDREVQT